MAKEVKFKAYSRDFVRDKYYSDKDRFKLSEEDIKEVLSYKDIKEPFDYYNWYGTCTPVECWISSVEKGEYDSIIFTVECDTDIPKHYIPTPSQILKGKGLLYPISVSRI